MPDLDALLDAARRLVDEALVPHEAAWLQSPWSTVEEALKPVRERAKREGLWTPQLGAAHGGPGLSLADFGRVSEVLGRSPFGHYAVNAQAPDAGNMELLAAHASPAQRERFLKPLLQGRARSCFAMTEPEHAGSNPTVLSTTARRDGDHFVLDGHKWFTTGADGATFAVVMAVTDPDAAPHERASLLLVPTDTPGFRLVRNLPVMGDTGGGWASHAELRLESCRVPEDHLIGEPGRGFAYAQERLGPGRIHHCMRWIGICERALEMTIRRAGSRMIAPGTPLGARQAVQFWIAESRAEIDAARLLVLDTARRIDAEGAYAARVQVSTIKFFVAGVLQRVLDRAVQTHGGLGLLDDTPLAWWARHERGARIYDGADEVHKARVARALFKQHGYSVRRDA